MVSLVDLTLVYYSGFVLIALIHVIEPACPIRVNPWLGAGGVFGVA